MSVDLLLTFGVLVAVFIGLVTDLLSPDGVLLGGLVILVLGGVIDLERALKGFANSTLLALGSLYVVAAGLQETGALDVASSYILGEEQGIRRLLLRMCPSVTTYSAFLNNTPVVAMGIPAIRGWCRRHGVSPSKLLMPLAFSAVLGGICTLIGTSTNLVMHGLLQSHDMQGFGFFELAWAGVPCAVVGLAYVVFVAPALLPERGDIREEEEEERADLVEIEVATDSPLVGETVEDADLKLMPGLTLVRIDRGVEQIAPVQSDATLQPGDRLLFTTSEMEVADGSGPTVEAALEGADDGTVEALDETERVQGVPERDLGLSAFPGLRLAYADIERGEDRELHQVVVREGSSLIGEEVSDIPFRERFGAVLTGIRRGGERLEPPLGDVRLRPGDALLLDTKRGFRGGYEKSREFVITSEAGGEDEKTEEEAREQREEMRPHAGGWELRVAVAVIVAIVGLVGTGTLHIAVAGPLGALVLVAAGVLTPGRAREAVDWNVLIVIGAALGIGQAMEASGAAKMMGEAIVNATKPFGPYGLLAGLILGTAALTNIVTNNGAVALMFPIALSVVESQGLAPRAFMVSITLAASMAFSTPIGYQANLMVYGPGNYRFVDFVRVGGILQVLLWIVLLVVAPLVWPM
ncbi:MAG: SLC13 family permease [Salinibacter sp.]|uniref:SLC13 family permease n=1 Tax=Salinibacter sp. TaxID=2065818 RepID=UPI0035D41530